MSPCFRRSARSMAAQLLSPYGATVEFEVTGQVIWGRPA